MARDYYRTLGVKKGASEAEIKRVYRRLARELHPDVTGDDKASTERFKEITEAYEVLSDTRRRRSYDLFGAPDDKGATGASIDLDTVLDQLFPNRKKKAKPSPGVDYERTLRISLREAFVGCEKVIDEGRRRRIKVTVPAGVDDGTRLRLKGQGEGGEHGGPAGDLYVIIRVYEDARFRREGADLLTEVKVSLKSVLLGAKLDVPLPDGQVRMTIPAGTQGGQVFRLRQQGFARLAGGTRGDLLVTLQVEIPRTADKDRPLVEQLLEKIGVS